MCRSLRATRYMLYVTTLTRAWEMFFATFAFPNFLHRPCFADSGSGRDRERLNRLASDLGDAMRRFTSDPLRNVHINTVVKRAHPGALNESETAIANIRVLYDVRYLLTVRTLEQWRAAS